MDPRSILVVDDDPQIQHGLSTLLSAQLEARIDCRGTVAQALEALATTQPGLILLDLGLPDGSGTQVYHTAQECCPGVPIIVLTGQDLIGPSTQALKEGCYDYLTKPVPPAKLLKVIRNALDWRDLNATQRAISHQLGQSGPDQDLVGGLSTNNPGLQRIYALAATLAPHRVPLLILGPTGTGKDVLARAIHQHSQPKAPYIALNIAGLDDHLVADALFGHKRGAFTGANESREGAIVAARGGTLFLDEIGDLSLPSQIKLLRVLENQEFQALGSDVVQKAQCRFIFATNMDLEAPIAQGRFRRDLYYRINTHVLTLPSLAERIEDLPWLAQLFHTQHRAELGLPPAPLPANWLPWLSTQDYPGNIRELKSVVRRLHYTPPDSTLTPDHTDQPHPPALPGQSQPVTLPEALARLPRLPTFAQALKELAAEALTRSGGNQAMAARMLGLSPQAFHHRLQQWDDLRP